MVVEQLGRPACRALSVSLAGAVSVAGVLAAVPRAEAEVTPSVSITVTPSGLLAGDPVVATGTTSSAVDRPLRLQRLDADGAWHSIASGATTGRDYRVTAPDSVLGSYRVGLTRFTSGGSELPAVVSPVVVVKPASVLQNGRTMRAGQYLTSGNGAYRLTMGTDGDLVLASTGSTARTLWHTGTSGHPGARLVMQYRGNLVLVTPANAVLWQSSTSDDSAELALYTTGALLVRSSGKALWQAPITTSTPPPSTTPPSATSAVTVRADSWVSAHVRYSQSRYYTNKYGSYRTDCSGFVSMALALKSSYTTRTLPSVTSVISKSSLRTGDILNAYDYHVVLFDKWANAAKTQYWIYEQSPSGGATHHVIPYPYYSGHRTSSFIPRRLVAKKVQEMAGRGAQMSQGSDRGPVDVP